MGNQRDLGLFVASQLGAAHTRDGLLWRPDREYDLV